VKGSGHGLRYCPTSWTKKLREITESSSEEPALQPRFYPGHPEAAMLLPTQPQLSIIFGLNFDLWAVTSNPAQLIQVQTKQQTYQSIQSVLTLVITIRHKAYCNGFAHGVHRQRLYKHGDYTTVESNVCSVPSRTSLVAKQRVASETVQNALYFRMSDPGFIGESEVSSRRVIKVTSQQETAAEGS
jgi:hypothetical protein